MDFLSLSKNRKPKMRIHIYSVNIDFTVFIANSSGATQILRAWTFPIWL